LEERRGYDHGTWVPLLLMRPQADIPVVQLSVNPEAGPDWHYKIGRALEPLTQQNVLILGSGAATHNLRELFGNQYPLDAPAPDWVKIFGDWLDEQIVAGDIDALLHYRTRAPHAVRNHPTEEHLLPLYVALGAAGERAVGARIHTSHQYGVLMMAAYAFQA
jgi:4,5-DOPA dioxygenase extradiol